MTTESQHDVTRSGGSVLLGTAIGALCVGLLASGIAFATSGPPAGLGALVGTLFVVLVFVGGAFAVNVVARIMPSASMMVALMTYLLQVVIVVAFFIALSDSGLVPDVLNDYWLAGSVILGTLGWSVCQIILTMRLRLPVYDLTDASGQ